MKIAIIGGKLQGVEAAYLARKAGWETILIDRSSMVPASGLTDIHHQIDIFEDNRSADVLKGIDLIIPATENRITLDKLEEFGRTSPIHSIYDPGAYNISSSKLRSNDLFSRIRIPVPEQWPQCGFPVIAKPSIGSGSKGVRIISDQHQFENFFPGSLHPEEWVLQEFIEGPSYSLEVVGAPGNHQTLQVTDLWMDAGYDCKRVSAPTELSSALTEQFKTISLQIADAVKLHGIMDVEVILDNGKLKVLEIDARLPSQTPIVVYHSSGNNLLEMLNPDKNIRFTGSQLEKGVIFEHIRVTPGSLEICGEHIMAAGGPLHLSEDFFGSDEAITNYNPGADKWSATLIIKGSGLKEARQKRENVINDIRARFKLDLYIDPEPNIND